VPAVQMQSLGIRELRHWHDRQPAGCIGWLGCILFLLLFIVAMVWEYPDCHVITGRSLFRTRFALVIPFVELDIPKMIEKIPHWPNACSSDRNPLADVILYFNKHISLLSEDSRPTFTALHNAVSYKLQECVNSVFFLSANLTDAEDGYPHGISSQFYKLMLEQFADDAFPADYKYIFWFEHDVKPLRTFWFDKLYEEVDSVDEFYLKGSIFRGKRQYDYQLARPYWDNLWLPHMNGNAFYRVGDAYWRSVINRTKHAFPAGPSTWMPWDTSLYLFMHDWSHFKEYQEYAHKILYTDVIQNLGLENNVTEERRLRERFPNTFFVHGDTDSSGRRITSAPVN